MFKGGFSARLLEISCHVTAKAKVSLLVPLIGQFKEMIASRSRGTEEQKHPAQKDSSKPEKITKRRKKDNNKQARLTLICSLKYTIRYSKQSFLRPSPAIKKCIIYQLTIGFNKM